MEASRVRQLKGQIAEALRTDVDFYGELRREAAKRFADAFYEIPLEFRDQMPAHRLRGAAERAAVDFLDALKRR
jgi:hypothetical protein